MNQQHFRPRRPALLATMAMALALSLSACGGKQDEAGSSPAGASAGSPEAAVLAAFQHLRQNDLGKTVAVSVPPQHLQEARQRWDQERREKTITDEERADFARTLERLTAPGAEAQMLAEIRPQLEQFQGEMKAQLPAMIAMGKGFVIASINESQDIPEANKPQVIDMLNAVGRWAETGEFADIGRAEKAIAEISRTARSLPIQTLDDVQALDFDGLMDLASVAVAGFKKAVGHYDIDIDGALDSARAETISRDGDRATVRVHFNLFDSPLSYDAKMVQVDGVWYDQGTIDALDGDDANGADLD